MVSRSYYKHNAGGTGQPKPGSEKWFKRNGHKRWRQAVKVALMRGDDPPELREVADVWGYPKDGVSWYGPGRRWT